MKRKIQLELLATSALAIVLTLLFAIFVFYGLFRSQVLNDLREDAWAFRNMHVFENLETVHPDIYGLSKESLRITVVDQDGIVLFDTDADSEVMETLREAQLGQWILPRSFCSRGFCAAPQLLQKAASSFSVAPQF